MDLIVAGLLGLRLMRDQARGALNSPKDHRDDQPWTLGPIPPVTPASNQRATARPPSAPGLPSVQCPAPAGCSVESAA